MSGMDVCAQWPLVSVVIPTWQRATLICHALDSVKTQDWRPIEVVVVDDGSDDGTDSSVANWATRHPDISVRYIWQKNAGGNAARNTGWYAANGTYVAFLDSDDTWRPSKITRQVALLTGPGNFGAVYCGLRETDAASGEVLNEPAMSYPQGDILNRLLVRDETSPTSAWIIRRDLLEQVGGFDEDLQARQDWDLWIRLAALTQIGAIPDALMDLRQHPGPRTASEPTRELQAYARIREKNAVLLAAQPRRVRLAARAAFHRRSGRVRLHYMHQQGRALGHYLLAVVIWPPEPDNYYALLGWFLPTGLKSRLRRLWNHILGTTGFSIRNH